MDTEQLLELIKSRRSIRVFDPDREVTDEQLQTLLEAARWAPSGGNVQPWKFFVVRDKLLKSKLSAAALRQNFLKRAPVVIAVCVNEAEARSSYKERGAMLYCLQDTAAATQNILLTAHVMGLGACWVGAFDEIEVAKLLHLPAGLRPVVMIPVGYTDEEPKASGRKPLEDVVVYRD